MPSLLLGYAALAALLLIVVAFLVARFLRARREEAARAAAAASAASAKEREAELLDSSHVGFAPLINGVSLPRDAGHGSTAERK